MRGAKYGSRLLTSIVFPSNVIENGWSACKGSVSALQSMGPERIVGEVPKGLSMWLRHITRAVNIERAAVSLEVM